MVDCKTIDSMAMVRWSKTIEKPLIPMVQAWKNNWQQWLNCKNPSENHWLQWFLLKNHRPFHRPKKNTIVQVYTRWKLSQLIFFWPLVENQINGMAAPEHTKEVKETRQSFASKNWFFHHWQIYFSSPPPSPHSHWRISVCKCYNNKKCCNNKQQTIITLAYWQSHGSSSSQISIS